MSTSWIACLSSSSRSPAESMSALNVAFAFLSVPHEPPQQLADRALGEGFVLDDDPLRHLVRRKVLLGKPDHVLGLHGMAGPRHHDGRHRFTPVLGRQTDHD